MCFGGGNSATKAAQKQEAERQANVSRNVAAVNSAFAGREGQYTNYADLLRKNYGTEFDRQQAQAARNLKFTLARSGLSGGSVARDQGRELAREGQQGAIDLERNVQNNVSNLRGADESARLQLISLAQSGTDVGDASGQAINALRANLGAAQKSNAATTLGDIFGGVSSTYKRIQDDQARRRGLADANPYGPAFGRGTT